MLRKPTNTELASLLGITEERFHREVKPLIKRQFSLELREIMGKTTNPDIWLDERNNIVLVHPTDEHLFFETEISISTYN